jgi:mannosyltransferase
MSLPAAAKNTAPRWPLLAAIGLVFVAAAMRLWQITESLWLDELHTAWCAAGSLGEVSARAAIGNQSPLFFWLEWFLVRLLGPSELSLRLLSLVSGSLLPLAVFLLARRWSTSGVGLLSAALITIDPMAIFYATEARPYALVQLLAVIQIAITAEMLVQPSNWLRASWIAIGALLFHLHYTAALLIPAEVVFYGLVAVLQPRDVNYRWSSHLLDLLVLSLLCLPAIANLGDIFARRANWAAFIQQRSIGDIFDWWPYALGAWYIAAALLMQGVAIAKSNATDIGSRIFGWLLLCWLFIPALFAWITTTTDVARLFFPRYLLITLPAAMLLAAACADLAPWRWSKVTVGSLILAVAIWASGIVESMWSEGRVVEPRGEDWRGCIAWLNEQFPQTQFPVLVFSGLIESNALLQPHNELLEDYCLYPVTSLYPLDVDRADMAPLPLHEPGRLNQVAEMLVVHRGGSWLIVRGNEKTGQQVAAAVSHRLEQSNAAGTIIKWQVQQARSFGRVQALLLATEPMESINRN